MDFSQKKTVNLILIMLQATSFIQCHFNAYFPVYYPEDGEYFILDVITGKQIKDFNWTKEGKPLPVQRCYNNTDTRCKDLHVYSLTKRADLLFR